MILASLIRPELPAQKEKGGALRELYESLRPAANLAADFDINLLQPKGLAAKLYPFQKRTVGLLLRNEGVATNGQPERDEPTDQWTNLDLDSFGHFAFSHLTGELRRLSDHKGKGRSDAAERLPTFFSTKEVRGTMLCEEMGE
jgi:hypothetical protein